jgi:hypothetical protein
MNDYETLAEVLASVQHFIEELYNRNRLHSAICRQPSLNRRFHYKNFLNSLCRFRGALHFPASCHRAARC